MQDDDGRLVEAIARAICRAHCGPRMRRDEPDRVECQVENGWDMWTDEARAALVAIEREGFKVVPVEPTGEMIAAARESGAFENDEFRVSDSSIDSAIFAALSASPKQG